ncbi:MAG: hypothetical protein PHG20_09950 [Geobacteraceae bacterium]|nr:hypothetical protein [Geobacteraceae bacterium]
MDGLVAHYFEMPSATGFLHHRTRVAAYQHRFVLDEQVVVIQGERLGETWHGPFIDGNLTIVFADILQRQLEGPDDPIGETCQTDLVCVARFAQGDGLFADVPVVLASYSPEKSPEILAVHGTGQTGSETQESLASGGGSRRSASAPEVDKPELDSSELRIRWGNRGENRTYHCQVSKDTDFKRLLVDKKSTNRN